MSSNKAGIVVAVLVAGWHAIWSVLVLAGWAQPFIDFIFWLHFIKPVYVIEPFSLGRALGLIGLAAVAGYAIGASFAVLWNRMQK